MLRRKGHTAPSRMIPDPELFPTENAPSIHSESPRPAAESAPCATHTAPQAECNLPDVETAAPPGPSSEPTRTPEHQNAPESASTAGTSSTRGSASRSDPPTLAEDLEPLFQRLSGSAFRSRFRLRGPERSYIEQKGLPVLRRHAEDFVRTRLAAAFPPNDGRQTPMRGHPVFIAQHATGCCCRGCLAKWHGIPTGRPLTDAEQQYIVRVLLTWIARQLER